MRTYLTVMFSTEGSHPSEVVDRLQMIGFKPCTGNYDFVYEWDNNATLEDTIYFADKVHEVLKDMGVLFSTETDDLPGPVPDEDL
ncbi:MAG: hypothetical protein KAJ64_07135 [Thermoplasmata archaeon]|nr:hypothetical protein [Thermoplasmata archaeon]